MMRLVEAFRDGAAAARLVDAIRARATRPWTMMEVCGGQTNTIVRYGIDQLLPEAITLVHGPGCPVCVTPTRYVDKAIALAQRPGVTLCAFGDMLRVPGSATDLLGVRARGGDVRAVTSPLDAVAVARAAPERQVVFFAVGFETTAPANAMAIHQARRLGLANFSALVCQVLVPPAMTALLDAPDRRVQGFLAAGHVCTVMGLDAYRPIAARWRVPIVATGFEPLDLLQGILMCLDQLEEGRCDVENQYARAVRPEGNPVARDLVARVFRVVDRQWRGLGEIPASGLALAPGYADLDAETRFGPVDPAPEADGPCIAGLVLRGVRRPTDCPAFGTRCTPAHPLGVTMVSEEGACAAYHRYRGAAE